MKQAEQNGHQADRLILRKIPVFEILGDHGIEFHDPIKSNDGTEVGEIRILPCLKDTHLKDEKAKIHQAIYKDAFNSAGKIWTLDSDSKSITCCQMNDDIYPENWHYNLETSQNITSDVITANEAMLMGYTIRVFYQLPYLCAADLEKVLKHIEENLSYTALLPYVFEIPAGTKPLSDDEIPF